MNSLTIDRAVRLRLAGAAAIAALGLAGCASSTATEASPSATPDPTVSVSADAGPALREAAWVADLGSETWTVPAIAGDLALVGTVDGVLHAITIADGSIAWQFQTEGALRGSATADSSAVYVSSDDGNLYALSLDGEPLWTTQVNEPAATRSSYDNYGSKPAVVDGVVYASGFGGIVAAVDAGTGAVLWTFDVEGPVETNIAVADGRVHVTAMNARHVALDAANGSLLWELGLLQPGTTSPLVMGDSVILGSRSANIQVRDAATGDKIWTSSYGGSWVQSGAAAYSDTAFAIGSSDLGVVRAFDIATGDVQWNVNLGGWPWGVPAAADGVVYATNLRLDYQEPWDTALHAIDGSTGEVLWSAAGGDSVTWTPDGYHTYGAGAGPVVAGDLVIAAMLDGTVRAYDR